MTTEQVPIKEFTLTTVIRNVSQMKVNEAIPTELVNQCNDPWKIAYLRTATYFTFFVFCKRNQSDADWSISTTIHASLNSSDGKCFSEDFTGTFSNQNKAYCEFVTNDELVFEIKFEIHEMTGIEMPPRLKSFDDNQAKIRSDVTLLVEDRRFHVSKFILAHQSTYFEILFFGSFKESQESEITLKEIDPAAFQVYLEVLHLEPALTDSCIEDVLELSHMYDSKNVTRVCEEFLLYKSTLSTKNKLQMACQFDLKKLKENCLESLKTAADIRAVKDCGGFENGVKDPEVLSSLVEKSLSFMRLE